HSVRPSLRSCAGAQGQFRGDDMLLGCGGVRLDWLLPAVPSPPMNRINTDHNSHSLEPDAAAGTLGIARRPMHFQERVIGCFKGLATGDTIGKQTEILSRAEVHNWYPGGVTGFHGRPGDIIPRYAGKRYEWRIGETTDDTEQTLAVARALLKE